jgi:hypothetical protein
LAPDGFTPPTAAAPATPIVDPSLMAFAGAGPHATILYQGSLEDRAPADGLAAQTPSTYLLGVRRLELLRGPDDPDPAVVFDLGKGYALIDMHERNEVAKVSIPDLPSGTFTHFRVSMTHAEVAVAARLHDVPVVGQVDTTLGILYGFAEVHVEPGLKLSHGAALVTASLFGQDVTVPTTWTGYPLPEPGPGAWTEVAGGQTVATWPLDPPLQATVVVPSDVTFEATFFIADGFRWQDAAGEGHGDGVWDVRYGTPPSIETVVRFGANDLEYGCTGGLELPN